YCLASFYYSDFTEHYDLAGRGFFSYKQLLGDRLPGPYGRQRSPMRPVHIDQLPPDLRETIGQVRFEGLCFAETVRGQEAHYRAFYEEFLGEAPPGAVSRLRTERPSGSPASLTDG